MTLYRIINASAPTRICDLGGWTDTWFAGQGYVLNIAVQPCAEVQILVYPHGSGIERIVLNVENYAERYTPGESYRHALLEATCDELGFPDDVSVEISIFSEMPSGASTGTSAAVTIALIGALAALNGRSISAYAAATYAHAIETRRLGLQSGIQDQLCSAYGGICFIDMQHYPHASVSPLQLPGHVLWELEQRMLLVFLGKAHSSSALHEQVIAGLEQQGPAAQALLPLRAAALHGRNALLRADLKDFGAAMQANTDAQRALHAALVCAESEEIIALAQQHNAWGWKINGAGGDGGSLSILCGPSATQRRQLIRAIQQHNPAFQIIPIQFSHQGLRVWETQL